jgi:hypothetical protein
MNGDGKLDLIGFDQSIIPTGNSNVSLLQVSLQ